MCFLLYLFWTSFAFFGMRILVALVFWQIISNRKGQSLKLDRAIYNIMRVPPRERGDGALARPGPPFKHRRHHCQMHRNGNINKTHQHSVHQNRSDRHGRRPGVYSGPKGTEVTERTVTSVGSCHLSIDICCMYIDMRFFCKCLPNQYYECRVAKKRTGLLCILFLCVPFLC